jgi:hypothetical protein
MSVLCNTTLHAQPGAVTRRGVPHFGLAGMVPVPETPVATPLLPQPSHVCGMILSRCPLDEAESGDGILSGHVHFFVLSVVQCASTTENLPADMRAA